MPERTILGMNLSRALSFVALAAFVGLIATVAIYVWRGPQGNQIAAAEVTAADADCADAAAGAARLDPYAVGTLAAFRVAETPASLRHVDFTRPDGSLVSLADFAGKTVLLNLWATWCIPCREEMPALDRLATELVDRDFVVVAVNLDVANPGAPQAFLDEINVRSLDLYLDPGLALLGDVRRIGAYGGLPTTVLIDPSGCRLGLIEGPADWASPDALALVTAALAL